MFLSVVLTDRLRNVFAVSSLAPSVIRLMMKPSWAFQSHWMRRITKVKNKASAHTLFVYLHKECRISPAICRPFTTQNVEQNIEGRLITGNLRSKMCMCCNCD